MALNFYLKHPSTKPLW